MLSIIMLVIGGIATAQFVWSRTAVAVACTTHKGVEVLPEATLATCSAFACCLEWWSGHLRSGRTWLIPASTSEHVMNMACCRTQGKYNAPLFTSKARLQPYVLKTHPQMTSIFPSFAIFYTNWVEFYQPKCALSERSDPSSRGVLLVDLISRTPI